MNILETWTKLKAKLKPLLLTPKEKETYQFLSKSKLSISLHPTGNYDLEQLEKDIKIEQEICNGLDVEENDLITDVLDLVLLILSWIELNWRD